MEAPIVIIEDNKADVVLIREALEEHGVRRKLTVLSDGAEAIRFLETESPRGSGPCLMVLDLNLPKVDGMDVLRAIRKSADWQGAKVVILTTSDSPAEQATAESIGVRAYLRKPVDFESFMAIGGVLKRICEEPEGPRQKRSNRVRLRR